ncbi:MAG: hypothetical protein WC137_00285 [Alphaproteobacteria bacterium]
MRKILLSLLFLILPCAAYASWGIVDALDLSLFIPIILNAFVSVAMATYEFFVGNGDGIIYILVWGWLGWFIGMYLVKMYIPQSWLDFFNARGGQMWEKPSALKISEDVLKPCIRGIIAAALLLPIKPQYITGIIVDPFLQFGEIYTQSMTASINQMNMSAGVSEENMACPPDLIEKGYISEAGCKFLIRPVAQITQANNQVIKRGLKFITDGLLGLMTLIPHGGRDIMNLITGIFLVFTFVASNFFMALLIIQAIFEFGMALIMYPFKVLTFVADKNAKGWVNPWPAFSQIIESLKKLVITMIACVFILIINIAAIKALFNFNHSTFVVAAGGSASSNVPVVANNPMGFGGHSIMWMSSVLTFFLMFKIFEITKKQLMDYTGSGSDSLYNKAIGDTKNAWSKAHEWRRGITKAIGWFKKK